ncbi:hypothetical protein [Leptospira ilyithenensis]|uniref:DUF4932 domain-containing protein n=1 Tax=Leptospira ilyithenensis TaxID=2484901 RepID=A0A4V3JXT8_9LEPT|nr:hypothetical protein [Leptospira ilyithenensis]TGN14659.1 hypothetical protein EHS11_01325 [Leptospira ilyithenensis]
MGAEDLESYKESCTASLKEKTFSELIRTLAFKEAEEFCDIQYADNPKKDCRASARYWSAVKEFSEQRFESSLDKFKTAKQILGGKDDPKDWQKRPGWGATDDMIRYLEKRSSLGKTDAEYKQKVAFIYLSETDAEQGGKRFQSKLDPCTIGHLNLSMGLVARYLETFTNGRFSLEFENLIFNTKVTKLETKMVSLTSLQPWTEDFAVQLGEINRKFDTLLVVFPQVGGRATGGSNFFPIIPGVLNGEIRGTISLPAGWATVSNYPQIFHEYLHTVEMMTGIESTSHGSAQQARIEAFTGLPKSGESDWAEWFFRNTILEKVNQASEKKGGSGWKTVFGRSASFPFLLSDESIRKLYRLKNEKGEDYVKELRNKAEEYNKQAYKLYNSQKNKEAAEQSFLSATTFPWTFLYIKNAKWFIENSSLKKDSKEIMLEKLKELKKEYYPTESD